MQINNPVTAASLGLGTAATKNTGTSGASVPLLNTAVTFSQSVAMPAVRLNPGDIDAINFSGNFMRFASPDGLYRYYAGNGSDPRNISTNGSHVFYGPNVTGLMATIDATGLDVVGLSRCDSFRIDQAPAAETLVCTHSVTFNINGTNYKLPMQAA